MKAQSCCICDATIKADEASVLVHNNCIALSLINQAEEIAKQIEIAICELSNRDSHLHHSCDGDEDMLNLAARIARSFKENKTTRLLN